MTAAQARFYGNQLGDAWARITKISDAAPANGNARLAVYQIANARGWPRRAEAEAEIAASLAPRDLGSRIALVEVAIASYRYVEAQKMLAELQALYPDDQAVRRALDQDFHVFAIVFDVLLRLTFLPPRLRVKFRAWC